MKKKTKITVVLSLILLLCFIAIVVLIFWVYQLRTSRSGGTSVSNRLLPFDLFQNEPSTRGTLVDMNEMMLFQFPVTVLSEALTENEIVKLRVSPFGSVDEEADMYIGPGNSNISLGECSFTQSGEITSTVTWRLVPVSTAINTVSIGDQLLVRVTYPKNPVGDQIEYTNQLKKQIQAIQDNTPLAFFSANTFCTRIQ